MEEDDDLSLFHGKRLERLTSAEGHADPERAKRLARYEIGLCGDLAEILTRLAEALIPLLAEDESAAVARIQELLDPFVLARIEINPESRVKIGRAHV